MTGLVGVRKKSKYQKVRKPKLTKDFTMRKVEFDKD